MWSLYSGTSLFQPCLGPEKVAVLVRWLDFREDSLYYCHTLIINPCLGNWPLYSEVAAFNSKFPLYNNTTISIMVVAEFAHTGLRFRHFNTGQRMAQIMMMFTQPTERCAKHGCTYATATVLQSNKKVTSRSIYTYNYKQHKNEHGRQ